MALPIENSRWQRAIELANRGQLDEARALFGQIAEEDPRSAGVWRWLANVTPEGGQRVEFLERALELNPADSSTRAELHDALVRQGVGEAKAQKREVARQCFERAIEILPEEEIAFLWLIEVSDDVQQRVDALERLFELQPKDRSIRGALARDLTLLAQLAADDGEPGLERSHYRRAHKLDAENQEALLYLAGDERESLGKRLEMLEAVLSQDPEQKEAKVLWDDLARQAATESSTLPVNCCPVCRAPKEPTAMKCGYCGVVLSLFDVGKLLQNQAVDRSKVAFGIEKLKERVGVSDDWRVRKSLLLALLNMGQRQSAAREANRLLDSMPLAEPQRLEIEQVQLFLLRVNADDEQGAEELTPTPDRPATEPNRAEVILVVDDSATVRTLVGATLEEEGYEAAFASTGMEALASLRQQVPSLVLLDIGLPNMDGYQLCQLIRQNPSTADVPVVMLSARDGFFDQVRGRMVGCQDYITKPFDSVDLLARVAKLVSPEA